MSDSKLNEIDGRLRTVETDVATMKERLNHMPTTVEMQKMLNGLQAKVIGTIAVGVVGVAVKWAWPFLFNSHTS